METLRHDLRYTWRALSKNPGFTAVAVLALALGIGANTAIFSVVNSILLKPLSYREPERLAVTLHSGAYPVSPADYLDYKRQVSAFKQMAAAQAWGGALAGSENTEVLSGLQVTANLMPMLGVEPLLGRWFTPEEDQAGAHSVILLGYGLWQRRFGGDPRTVGSSITLDGVAYTVVGVMPSGFRFAPFWQTQAEMWTPLVLAPRVNDRGGRSLRVFGRLKAGVSIRQAQAEMDTIRPAGCRLSGDERETRDPGALAAREGGRADPTHAVCAAWRGGFRAPHCLRKRIESDADARHRAEEGNGAAVGDRGQPMPSDPSFPDGKYFSLGDRRRGRRSARPLGVETSGGHLAEGRSSSTAGDRNRRCCIRIHSAAVSADRNRVRSRARSAGRART